MEKAWCRINGKVILSPQKGLMGLAVLFMDSALVGKLNLQGLSGFRVHSCLPVPQCAALAFLLELPSQRGL